MDFRYFSGLGEGKRLGRILQAGRLVKEVPQEWRTLTTHAVVLLERGEGFFQSENRPEESVEKGDLMFLFPKVAHRYGPQKPGHWEELFIVFEGPLFDLWQTLGWIDPRRPVWKTGASLTWSRRFEGVLKGAGFRSEEQALAECARLQCVLADLIDMVSRRERRPGDRVWKREVEQLLESDATISPDLLARRLGMRPRSLRERFRRVFGESLRDWKVRRQVSSACQLLIETGLPVRQIAFDLGFCDEFYFSAAFKKAAGHSPVAYRRTFGPSAG